MLKYIRVKNWHDACRLIDFRTKIDNETKYDSILIGGTNVPVEEKYIKEIYKFIDTNNIKLSE